MLKFNITQDEYFISMNNVLKNSFKITIAILLLWFLIHNSWLNMSLLTAVLYSPLRLLYFVIIIYMCIALSAWRWYRLNVAQNFKISYGDTFMAVYIGFAFNNLLPGSVGGDVVRVAYLFKRIPQNKVAGILSVLTDRVTGLLGVIFGISLIGLFWTHLFMNEHTLTMLFYFCVSVSVSVVVVLALLLLFPGRFDLSTWVVKFKSLPKISHLLASLNMYKQVPWILVECIFVSIIVQILMVIGIQEISIMQHFEAINFLHYLAANMISQLATLIPISPGGLGLGEASFANTVMQLDPETPAAYATIFLTFRILTMLISVPALFVYFKKGLGSRGVELEASKNT